MTNNPNPSTADLAAQVADALDRARDAANDLVTAVLDLDGAVEDAGVRHSPTIGQLLHHAVQAQLITHRYGSPS